MTIKNYYSIFNVDFNSNLNTIKKAFRKEITIYHPENNKSEEAKERFDDLVEGYNILSDTEKRKAYNTMLESSEKSKPIVIEQQKQYDEWQKEAKTKSKEYRNYGIDDFLALDLFGEVAIEAIIEGSKLITEGSESLIEGIGETIGDVIGGIFDSL